MLACRVLRGSGKSPRQWLAEVDDETFYDWKAYFDLEPWCDEKRWLVSIATTLKRLLALKFKDEDCGSVLDGIDRITACQMPASWICQPEEVDAIAQAEVQAAGLYGHSN